METDKQVGELQDENKFHQKNDNIKSTETSVATESTRLRGAIILGCVAGMSTLFGFGITVAMARKKDPTMFNKSMVGGKELPESGSLLAMRALGWGTLYSVSGVSLLCFAVWKLLGVHNKHEFREKMGSIMPKLPKKKGQGKSDFKTVRELINYILEEDSKAKAKKKS